MVRVALALILFFQTLTAYAGPPFITDDPSPVDYKHINVFLYTNYVNSPANRDLFLPGIEVDYGLAPRLEIDLLLSYDWHRNYTEPHRSTSGVGDSQISLKYEIWHETPTFPQVAFAPGYFFPTGSEQKRIGNGRSWLLLPIWLQKTAGAWTCYGGGGWAFNSDPGNNNFRVGGMVLQKTINDTWTLGGEFYAQSRSSAVLAGYSLVNLGGYYSLSDSLVFLFSGGGSIAGARFYDMYAALSWDFAT